MLMIILLLLLLGGGAALFAMRNETGGAVLAMNARLGRYGLAGAAAAEAAEARGPRQPSGISQSINRLVGRGRLGTAIASQLEQADLTMTPGEFVALNVVAFLVGLLFGFVFKGMAGALILGLAALVGPFFYLRRRVGKRKQKFVEQLSDIAQMMANSMRAGFSIIQSMDLVAHEGPKPAAQEFERVVTEIKLGLPLDSALDHLIQRQPSEDLELMVVAVNVQRQIGGNLSEILAVIANTIRERVRFQRDLRTLTAQARYSSYIITALPIGVALVINLMDQPYESALYTTTMGYFMLGAAVVMMICGFFALRKIANIEV